MNLTEVLAAFSPSAPLPAAAPLRESYDLVLNDPDADLATEAQGGSRFYRRLTQTERDLPPLAQEKMLALAYHQSEATPLARRVVELTRDFVVGEGISVTAQDDGANQEAVQGIIDGFWKDSENRLDLALYDYVYEQALFGELILTARVNPVNGHVVLGYVDPAAVKAVLVDEHNVRQATDVVLKSKGGAASERLKVIRTVTDPQSEWFGRLRGVETDARGTVTETFKTNDRSPERPYLGACFYFPINKVSTARRGRSDLLWLLDWIDAYDQTLLGEVDRNLLMRSFIWDVEYTGASEAQLADYIRKNSNIKPGSIRAHNEKVKWAEVTPDLKAQDAQTSADLLISYVSTGAGVPKTWVNGTMDVNRAIAIELSEPAFKRVSARQKYVRACVEQMITFALDQAEMAGRLRPKRSNQADTLLPEPWGFTVNAPEVRARDLKSAGEVLKLVTEAVIAAQTSGIIDIQLAQEIVVLAAGQLGIEVDLEAMRERLEAEQAERDQAEAEMRRQMQQAPPEDDEEEEDEEPGPVGAGRNGSAP